MQDQFANRSRSITANTKQQNQGKSVIVDYEDYFTIDKCIRKGFYTSNIEKSSEDIQYRKCDKCSNKVLVWVAA